MAEDGWIETVLDFWFEELGPKDWFSVSQELDETIRKRFLTLHEEIASDVPDISRTEPNAALAAIIVLDQFPRNMFRGTERAFATDPIACDLSRNAVAQGFDRGLTEQGRQFLYMPMMHSETLSDQDRSVELFEALGNDNALQYAREHHDIISRFGRFPYRNEVLSRETTSEEETFLADADTYGQ